MEQDSTTMVIGVALIVCLIALFAIRIVEFFSNFNSDTRYLLSEINRAGNDVEYRYWRRELRCHYLCLIPFVTERNVMRVYRVFFHRAKHAEKRSDGLAHILAPSVIGIFLCAIWLCGASWAWFTASTSTGIANIQSATYTVSVTAKQNGTAISPTVETGITTVKFGAAEIYTVTLTPTGTATTGYCKIAFDGNDYYTEQLTAGSLTFTVRATAGTCLTVTPQWGTYSGTATIHDGGEITAAGYQQNRNQTPDNSANNEPAAESESTAHESAATDSTPIQAENTGDASEPTLTPGIEISDETAASADSVPEKIE